MIENLYTVSQVFSDRLFRIPDYQRGYAWSRTQWDDLLQDLELLPESKEHFTGTLILHKPSNKYQLMDEEGKTYTLYDVIDGQQRLTTTVLLLDALRREMQLITSMNILSSGIEKNFIGVNDINGQPVSKLTLNRDTHKFFYNTVLGRSPDIEGPTIRSHQLLARGKEHFADYFAEKRAEFGSGYQEWLTSFYAKISQRVTMMVYEVDAESDAWVIFETMNDRGKPITELEKVKNYLLYLSSKLELKKADHTLTTDINHTWTHIFEHLMAANLGRTENEDQLLRAHWLMGYDYELKNWKGSRSIKDHFSLRRYQGHHNTLLQDMHEYIDTLRNAATAYCDVFNPTHSSAFNSYSSDTSLHSKVKAISEKLARLGNVTHFLPLLMAVRLKYPSDAQKYLTTAGICEKYAFRVYKWEEYRSHTGRSQLYRMGNHLFMGGRFQEIIDSLIRLTLHYCSNKQFLKDMRVEDDEDWFHWSGLRYFLYEYEEHLAQAEKKEVKMPWEMLESKPNTIEHILPQTPRKNSDWLENFSKKERRRYTHDIGNLCLTQDNSILSNKSFSEKKGKAG